MLFTYQQFAGLAVFYPLQVLHHHDHNLRYVPCASVSFSACSESSVYFPVAI